MASTSDSLPEFVRDVVQNRINAHASLMAKLSANINSNPIAARGRLVPPNVLTLHRLTSREPLPYTYKHTRVSVSDFASLEALAEAVFMMSNRKLVFFDEYNMKFVIVPLQFKEVNRNTRVFRIVSKALEVITDGFVVLTIAGKRRAFKVSKTDLKRRRFGYGREVPLTDVINSYPELLEYYKHDRATGISVVTSSTDAQRLVEVTADVTDDDADILIQEQIQALQRA